MIICALVFNESITLGNVIEICILFVSILFAYATLRERSKTNANLIIALKDRMDRCDVEQIKERVNTMWLFQLRRGLVEAEIKGFGAENSPFKLTAEANELLKPMLPELKQFYQVINGDDLGVVELANELERQFGHKIADMVCKKAKVSDAACMVLTIAQLRPISSATIDAAEQLCHEEALQLMKLRDLPVKRDVKGGFRWIGKNK
jgi:hypothetical protein